MKRVACSTDNRWYRPCPVKIGSDCSGLNAAHMAFEALGVPVHEVFASDSDPAVREVLRLNFDLDGRRVCDDITKRDHATAPSVQVYTAGFSCQSYSEQGGRSSLTSPDGLVGLHVVDYLANKTPKVFILENVAPWASSTHADDFTLMMRALYSIESPSGKPLYTLRWKILNTLGYGLAQNRKRLFIVGIRGETRSRAFRWPAPSPTPPLCDFLDAEVANPPEVPKGKTERASYLRAVKFILQTGRRLTDPYVADLANGFANGVAIEFDHSPCLTKSHCGINSYYCFARQRFFSLNELYRLQGIPDWRLKKPPSVTERQMRTTRWTNHMQL